MKLQSSFLISNIRAVALLFTTVTLATSSAFAENTTAEFAEAQNKGFAIAARSDRSDRGFGDFSVHMEMRLRNKNGAETTRSLNSKNLEVTDENLGDKSLIVFDKPRDIAGTSLLSHAKILEADDQWLFLPALKRVKRISSRNKSGAFVGSEFSFEDFSAQELNKFSYKWLGEEACGELNCDILERTPLYENSGYSRQISWVDQRDYQVRKIEFYDRRNALRKILTFSDYRLYNNKFWRSHTLTMVNQQSGKSTVLNYGEFSFATGLSDKDFLKSGLRRAR